MDPIVEVITERAILGEGPHWDIPSQSLYYIDIFGQTLNKYVPATNTHTKVKIDEGPVSFVVPVEGTQDEFLISIGRQVVKVTWNGISDTLCKREVLTEVDEEDGFQANRLNDGKADPSGRLWLGTMGPEPEVGKLEYEKGSLYSMNGIGEVKKHLTKLSISNGLAWNLKLNKMYFIDSPLRTVDEYDFDIEKGEIGNRKAIFKLDDHNIPGIPDGMTIDADGNLWVAIFDGSRLVKVNPNTSELLKTIDFPAKQITSAAFGGPNLDILYVTSAQLTINGVKQAYPAGAVFKVTNVGAKGLPGDKFKSF